MRIDYDSIMETIETQFKDILYGDMYFNGYQVKVAKEQDFNRIIDKDPNIIYVVVKFGAASLNYRQYLLPITIYALSEQNKLDACQKLLLDFCVQYNLTMSEDQTTKQFYSSPQVISNFEEIYYGYRSMLYMQGTFLVSKDSDPKKFYYVTKQEENGNIIEKEEIEILNYQTTCDIMLDSQPFYNTNNFSKSIGKIGTYLLNLTAYMVDTPFINMVNAIPDEDFETAPDGVNTTFTIEISRLKSGKSTIKNLKLVSVSDQGSIGEFPVITMTFSL